MTDMTLNPGNQRRSVLTCAGKTLVLAVSLGLAACGGGGQQAAYAQGQTGTAACSGALNSLMSDWDSIGFAEPSKPAQMVVAGRRGYSTSGGQFNYMRTQIRIAARDCEAGHDADSLSHIEKVREFLEQTHHI